MAERDLAIRLAVVDGGKVKATLNDVGVSGVRALQRIEEAARPASRALQALDGVAADARRPGGDGGPQRRARRRTGGRRG